MIELLICLLSWIAIVMIFCITCEFVYFIFWFLFQEWKNPKYPRNYFDNPSDFKNKKNED